MMRDGLCVGIDRESPEIRCVADERFLRLFGCRLGGGEFGPRPIRHNLCGHVPALVIQDKASGILAARGTRGRYKAPHANEALGYVVLRHSLRKSVREADLREYPNREQASSKSDRFGHPSL